MPPGGEPAKFSALMLSVDTYDVKSEVFLDSVPLCYRGSLVSDRLSQEHSEYGCGSALRDAKHRRAHAATRVWDVDGNPDGT